MSYQFERIEGQPILISTLQGQVNAVELRDWWQAVSEHTAAIGRGYHIIDVRQFGLDLNGMVGLSREIWVQEAVRRYPNFPLSPIVVGQAPLARMAASVRSQPDFSHLVVPIFASREEALSYIRGQTQ